MNDDIVSEPPTYPSVWSFSDEEQTVRDAIDLERVSFNAVGYTAGMYVDDDTGHHTVSVRFDLDDGTRTFPVLIEPGSIDGLIADLRRMESLAMRLNAEAN